MEITNEYAKAYVEVLEIIKLLPSDLYKKIPAERIEIYEKYKDDEYEFSVDSNKNIDNQISEEAKNVISNLFIRFLAKDIDKESILKKERAINYENELLKKATENTTNMFKNNEIKIEVTEETNNEMTVINEEKWFKKLFNRIINFFKN